MERVTRTGSDQRTVQQMFSTLLGEIATLRRQNDTQQRQLEHLQRTTSLLLEHNKASLQPSGNFRFNHLPLEIREMIWELAIPCRLLAYPGMDLDVLDNDGVSLSLSVPAVAHVCRESRGVFAARHQFRNPSGSCHHPKRPPHLWRLKYDHSARWTSFRPRTDALLIDPCDFLQHQSQNNYPIPRVAEHIVVSSFTNWRMFLDNGFYHGDEGRVTGWVGQLAKTLPEDYSLQAPSSTWAPVCHLRTIDFAVNSVTEVGRNYPPNLVDRLFGGDSVKIIDLSDEEAMDTTECMIEDEMYQYLDRTHELPLLTDLRESLAIFDDTAADIFSLVKPSLLRTLVESYYNASVAKQNSAPRRASACLLSPLKDDKLDMDVTWVKDLCKRIDVRPVHVFVRTEGMSRVDW